MRTHSATTTVTHAVTVAAGVFAPGHLGELTQYLPFELVDDILAQTKTVQRRLRDLPSRVGVYFLLALGMYPRLGYARVWAKLTAGLEGLPVACPSEKALRDLRRRLGPVPLKALFEVVAGPLAGTWAMSPRVTGIESPPGLARSRSTIAAEASTPSTAIPRDASGSATRPVPMASSSTRPSPARPARNSTAGPGSACWWWSSYTAAQLSP